MKSKDILNSLVLGGSGGSSPAPSGSVTFTQNGTYDVSDKAEAVVNVPAPSGSVTLRQNGTYDVANKAQAIVNVPGMSWEELFGGNSLYYINMTDSEDDPAVGRNFFIPTNFANGSTQTGPRGDEIASKSRVTGINIVLTNLYSNAVIGSSAFIGCTNLTTLNLISEYKNISIMYNAFQYSYLQGDIDITGVSSIGHDAFFSCRRITDVHMKCDTVESQAFKNCTALQNVYFGDPVTIGANVFNGCSSLAGIVLRSSSLSTLEDVNAFENTPFKSDATFIYVPGEVIDAYKKASNWSEFASYFRVLEDYTLDGTTNTDLDPDKV